LVAIEAMISGKAVVASQSGGLCDIVVDGETGVLVPPGEPGALRAALTRLLEDRRSCERMGEAGRIRVQQFQASAVIPRIEAAYQRALEKRLNQARVAQNGMHTSAD
jgi:glycosyltransferase involved in cell wall biosynthesis